MARINHYDQGDVWTPQATFTVAAAATDPDTITLRVKEPDGTVTVYGPYSGAAGGAGVTRTSVGVYTAAIVLDQAGYWFARWEGTGAAAGAVEHQATVDPSEFYDSAQLSTSALVSLPEAKDWLNIQNIDASNDLDITRVINDISERMQEEAEREFVAAGNPQTRTFPVVWRGPRRPWYVDHTYMGDYNPSARTIQVGDLASFTQVQIIDTDWTTVLETVDPASITAHPTVRKSWEPITALEFASTVTGLTPGMRVAVTGTFGFPSVPGSIRQACLDAVAWTLDRDVEHYRQDLGQLTSTGEQGNVIMVGGGSQRILSLPPAVLAACWAWRLPTVR